jgi:hypothetical protein
MGINCLRSLISHTSFKQPRSRRRLSPARRKSADGGRGKRAEGSESLAISMVLKNVALEGVNAIAPNLSGRSFGPVFRIVRVTATPPHHLPTPFENFDRSPPLYSQPNLSRSFAEKETTGCRSGTMRSRSGTPLRNAPNEVALAPKINTRCFTHAG